MLSFLNKQIDRDIEAQKVNLNRKNNLLWANMQQFKNIHDAVDMTRIQMNDIAADMLKKVALQTSDPILKAKALQNAGEIDMKAPENLMSIAQRRAMMNMMTRANQFGNVSQSMDVMRILNPAYAKSMEERYMGPSAGTKEELANRPIPEESRSQLIAAQNLDTQTRKLEEFSKAHGGTTWVQDPAVFNEGQALILQLQDKYRQAAKQGVFKPAEKDFVESIVGKDPTAFFSEFRNAPRYKALRETNLSMINDIRSNLGLSSYAPGGSPRPNGKPKPKLGPPVVK